MSTPAVAYGWAVRNDSRDEWLSWDGVPGPTQTPWITESEEWANERLQDIAPDSYRKQWRVVRVAITIVEQR